MSLRSCIINNLDPPFAPSNLEFLPESPTSAVLFWTPPNDSICVTSYTVTLTCTNIPDGNTSYSYNTTTNATRMTVFDLTQGAKYSFTVVAIDTGWRMGEESVSATTQFDSELMVLT